MLEEFLWTEVFNSDDSSLLPPSIERCVIRSAASPKRSGSVDTPAGEIPATYAAEVTINFLPPELKLIEFELEDDLWLRLPDGSHDVEIRVSSPESSHWFAISGGQVHSMTAIDSYVSGVRATTEYGVSLLGVRTCVQELHMKLAANRSVSIGSVEAKTLRVTGDGLLAIARLMNATAEVRTGSLAVQSGRILLGSTLFAGSLAKGTRISCETDFSKVVLGETWDVSLTPDLTMKGGTLHIVRGEVSGLTMVEMRKLVVGDAVDPTTVPDDIDREYGQALASQLGYGLVTGVCGTTRELEMHERAVIAGDSRTGFSVRRIAAASSSEISALNAGSFNLYSSGVLRDIRRVGLWVDPSTHKARELFESEVHSKSFDPEPALFELAHHRKQLLNLGTQTQQDGHTLSVLREAEKDARRASLPWRSRERLLLEAWRRVLGYGERIGYPLCLGAIVIALLGVGHVGWSRFWSRDWWHGWRHLDRINQILNFALPGIDAFGIDGIGGFWGVSAKIMSVVFFASAATAAIRVVKRGE